jgi:hypothetical protein
MKDKTFKNQIIEIVETIFDNKKIKFTIDHYTSENENETLNLTDINSGKCKLTIANDFALVVIEGEQYDFEEWRYKELNVLKDELKDLLNAKL